MGRREEVRLLGRGGGRYHFFAAGVDGASEIKHLKTFFLIFNFFFF